VMGVPIRWGLGVGLACEMLDYLSPRTFYWGGYGGSWVEIDPDSRTCFAYVMNKMEFHPSGDKRMLSLRKAFMDDMRKLQIKTLK